MTTNTVSKPWYQSSIVDFALERDNDVDTMEKLVGHQASAKEKAAKWLVTAALIGAVVIVTLAALGFFLHPATVGLMVFLCAATLASAVMGGYLKPSDSSKLHQIHVDLANQKHENLAKFVKSNPISNSWFSSGRELKTDEIQDIGRLGRKFKLSR